MIFYKYSIAAKLDRNDLIVLKENVKDIIVDKDSTKDDSYYNKDKNF